MKITVIPGNTYSVTTATGCTVTDERGRTLTTVDAGTQGAFMATSPTVTITDAEATVLPFADSPVIGNGGAKIKIDETPTEGSENAVSSGGVYEAIASFSPTVKDVIENSPEVAILSEDFAEKKLLTSDPNNGSTIQLKLKQDLVDITGLGDGESFSLSVNSNHAALRAVDVEGQECGFTVYEFTPKVFGRPLTIEDATADTHAASLRQVTGQVSEHAADATLHPDTSTREAWDNASSLAHSHAMGDNYDDTRNPWNTILLYSSSKPSDLDGDGSYLNSNSAVIIGDAMKIRGTNASVLIGSNVSGGRSGSTIVGASSKCTANFVTQLGYATSGTGDDVTIGSTAKASGGAVAVGAASSAGYRSVALGHSAKTTASLATAIGYGLIEGKTASTMLGSYNTSRDGNAGAFIGTDYISSNANDNPFYFKCGNIVREITEVTNDDGSVTTTTVVKNKGVRLGMATLMARLLELGGEEWEYQVSSTSSTTKAATAALDLDAEIDMTPKKVSSTDYVTYDGIVYQTDEEYSDGTKVTIGYNPDADTVRRETHYNAEGLISYITTTDTNGNTTTENYES